MRVELEPAFVLHRRPYRETSLLLEVLSLHHGRVGLIAKGVRRGRSSRVGLLQPFTALSVSWSGRGQLPTLTGVEMRSGMPAWPPQLSVFGLYLNELLLRLLARNDASQALFEQYEETLRRLLIGQGRDAVLRRFEVCLLQQLGYGLVLRSEAETGKDLQPDRWYRYELDSGPVLTEPERDTKLCVSGATLLALASGNFTNADERRQARRLMAEILNHYLGGYALKSRELLRRTWRRSEGYTRQ